MPERGLLLYVGEEREEDSVVDIEERYGRHSPKSDVLRLERRLKVSTEAVADERDVQYIDAPKTDLGGRERAGR
jgi:hypothetical protein